MEAEAQATQPDERELLNEARRPTLGGSQLSVAFEGVCALDGVDFELGQGDILGLIGPNGAGKTTLVNVLSGVVFPDKGEVTLGGTPVTEFPLWKRTRLGIARSFQGARLFRGLSVRENLEAPAIGGGRSRRAVRAQVDRLLAAAGLEARADELAAGLPAGEQQRLGMFRALATEPRFLLLDEPAAGLNEVESAELVNSIKEVRASFDCGVLVIEHDMSVIMSACASIQVLNHGKSIAVGTPDEIRRDPGVLEAYLGESDVES